jgi:release factor glutamine methyltransferase
METPEAYKKGFKDFLGVKVGLERRPLIPRDETEYWTSIVIKEIKRGGRDFHCLDLFSGSGCVGLAVLKNTVNSFCDFGDIDESFLDQVRANLQENNVSEERYNILQTNIFSNVEGKYDYILANPPYVALNRMDEVGEDVKEFEPDIALYAGNDGMDYIRIFLSEAETYLNENGKIFMELDGSQIGEIEKIISGKYSRFQFFKDQFDNYRFVVIEK